MFELLGTPAEHKKWMTFPGAHSAPRAALVRETLGWLERYRGGRAVAGLLGAGDDVVVVPRVEPDQVGAAGGRAAWFAVIDVGYTSRPSGGPVVGARAIPEGAMVLR